MLMQMRMIIGNIFIWVAIACFAWPAEAGEAGSGARVYMHADAFVAQAFDSRIPAVGTVWPNGVLRERLTEILGHRPGLRFKYWGANGKTVWVLEEIGKDRPITAGVSVADGVIEDIQVLVFRESRGWEVKYEFFTRQFSNLFLTGEDQLSDRVDSITGATLSVNAMTRMARAALLLHQHTDQAATTIAHAR